MAEMKSRKMGIVYLVGAGPGDPGMVTLKAIEKIALADVLVYDHLANPRLLSYAREAAEKIYVGKEASDHALAQEEINNTIARLAKEGKSVVRLKGGDPFIFGRGGEEAEYLAAESVPFEIVPGITSAIAVPAYAGIPLTHRDYTTSVAFITGHERPDKEESTIPWRELATGPKTLVFLMGIKNLPLITEALITYGRSPETPAAVIRWGTLNNQQTLTGTLSDISQRVKEAGMKPPAIILVGEVVGLRERLNWFEKRPLFGKTIVVTRTRDQASQLVEELIALGAQVIEYPTIKIKRIDPNPAIEEAIRDIKDNSKYHWVIFTSVNGVECFFHYMQAMRFDCRIFAGTKVCAIGPATAQRLESFGIISDIIPESFKAEGIIDALSMLNDIAGKNILIPRARRARDILPEQLSARGANVLVLPVYETFPDEGANTDELVKSIKAGAISMITFTSSSTVTNFFANIEGRLDVEAFKGIDMACIGPITENSLKEKGLAASVTPGDYTIPALVKAIEGYYMGNAK